MTTETLHNRTLKMLKARPSNIKYKQICLELDIKEPWLKAFASGRITDPSVNKVQALYEFLAGKKLDL